MSGLTEKSSVLRQKKFISIQYRTPVGCGKRTLEKLMAHAKYVKVPSFNVNIMNANNGRLKRLRLSKKKV